jgi:hypothetical protein
MIAMEEKGVKASSQNEVSSAAPLDPPARYDLPRAHARLISRYKDHSPILH